MRTKTLLIGVILAVALLALLVVACLPPEEPAEEPAGGGMGVLDATTDPTVQCQDSFSLWVSDTYPTPSLTGWDCVTPKDGLTPVVGNSYNYFAHLDGPDVAQAKYVTLCIKDPDDTGIAGVILNGSKWNYYQGEGGSYTSGNTLGALGAAWCVGGCPALSPNATVPAEVMANDSITCGVFPNAHAFRWRGYAWRNLTRFYPAKNRYIGSTFNTAEDDACGAEAAVAGHIFVQVLGCVDVDETPVFSTPTPFPTFVPLTDPYTTTITLTPTPTHTPTATPDVAATQTAQAAVPTAVPLDAYFTEILSVQGSTPTPRPTRTPTVTP